MPDTDPLLPRTPDDPENISRLRREAMRRLDAEGRHPRPERPSAATVYGGPPTGGGRNADDLPPREDHPSAVTVYGGPPPGWGGGKISRRWTLRRVLLLLLGLLAALAAIFFGARKIAAPVYGGPPPRPGPEDGPKPVYGGPVPRTETDSHRPVPSPKPHPQPSVPPKKLEPSTPPAAVYGGPPPDAPK